jgi:hypothetical protein
MARCNAYFSPVSNLGTFAAQCKEAKAARAGTVPATIARRRVHATALTRTLRMTAIDPPAWCRWRRGGSAVLVIAPHGGRREPLPPAPRPGQHARGRKVNDLHTADLAAELADTLDASLIVNPALDRNQLDLNRISQVAARAPWFLALIETLLADTLARHARAEVLFVHGWNVIQPKCDIGVGQALADAAAAGAHADALTVSPRYVAERLGRLQSSCAAAGIVATFGERYPGRHPNNLLQMFRHAAAGATAAPRLAEWAAARRVEAVQLELGVPVRWPGPCRRGFLQAAGAAFDGAGRAVARPAAAAATPAHGEPAPASLQLYDPRAQVGLTARVDSAGARSTGRLLVFLGRQRVALFIGEDLRGRRATGSGPHFTPTPDGFRLSFEGTALACEDGSLYVDLEQAFAASQLCAVAVDLGFRRGRSPDYGPAVGWIEVDGQRAGIDALAFARHHILQRSLGTWSSQLTLSAAFGPDQALRVRHEFPGAGGVLHALSAADEARQALSRLSVCFAEDRYTPQRIAAGDLLCEPLGRMAITRPHPPHGHARVTFGPARFTRGGEEGFGFYEYARALP